MFTERKSRSAHVNITYNTPTSHGWQIDNSVGLAREKGAPTLPSLAPVVQPVTRTCAACGAPLTRRWQRRACSLVCAGKLTPRRPQAGASNGNWKGGISKQPVRYVTAFKAANPEKVLAQRAVASAIRNSTLTRPSHCSACRRACRPDAHHFNYALPLCVDWLCRKCHVAADRMRQQRELQATATTLEQSKGHAHVVSESFNV